MEGPRRVVGTGARRIEDPLLLKGQARFLDDLDMPGMLHVAFVRSPHAHARVLGFDGTAARAMPGVEAVLGLDDLMPVLTRPRMPLGFPTNTLPKDITPFVLSSKEVSFVGDPVALVLATSRYIAEDAASLVEVDYEPLPVVTNILAAIEPNSPRVRTEFPGNILTQFKAAYGDVEGAFAKAPHVFREQIWQHRGAAHPLEGRGIIARYDEMTRALTLWGSTQMPHDLAFTAADMLGVEENRIRVISPEIGGGFGAKFVIYPEEIAVAAAGMLTKRPVKWIEDRREHFTSAIQNRDQFWDIEIALDAGGIIAGVRGRMVHDQGAYTPQGINLPFNAATSVTGPYIVPAYHLDVTVAQTNKPAVIPVRGAGYPEACFAMERLMDRAADELAIDRTELRRRNFVPASKMPYEKPLKNRAGAGIVLDSGDYEKGQDTALEAAGYKDFRARQAAALKEGRYIGMGVSHGVKGTGRGPFESATVRIATSGHVTVYTGAVAMGQGIKTILAQVCADQLGVAIEDIEVVNGDTGFISLGLGGFASRQTVTAGSSVHLASLGVREKAIKVAAGRLEVAEEDLVLANGKVHVAGVPEMSITLAEVARLLRGVPGYALPPGVNAGLEASHHFRAEHLAYAHSCHVCEVEVDIETGGVTLRRFIALQDSGTQINPMLVAGQVHGGVVHGIGNSLFEWMGYDSEGQPLTTTFADYLMATAPEIPNIEVLKIETPSPLNPLGVKGVGEGGTVPVAAAVISAIEDALRPFAVHIAQAPVSPMRLLELIDEARTRAA